MRMLNGIWNTKMNGRTRAACYGPSIVMATLIVSLGAVQAQDDNSGKEVKKTFEPVFRVSRLVEADTTLAKSADTVDDKTVREEVQPTPPEERIARNMELPAAKAPTVPAPTVTPHPLNRALSIAHDSLGQMRQEVVDYTATLRKRERVKGVVGTSYIKLKVRCPRVDDEGVEHPFSIYMKFLKPTDTAGREVIWVDGHNDGKLMVHEGRGILALKTFHLDPTSMIAMQGQRYPIYEAGVENLIVKLIEKAERDREAGPCVVNYKDGIKINKRPCSMIELIHDDRKPEYEFHMARVLVDDELNLPCFYAAYDWPTNKGEKPSLIEEYTYFNIKTNVGLTNADFDTSNPTYNYR